MQENRKELMPGDPAAAKEYFKNKIRFSTGPVEVNSYREKDEDFVLVDVREAKDFAEKHPPGAINLPRDQWDTFRGLDKNKVNILLCYSQACHLAAKGAVKFAANGYPVMEMDGGFAAWEEYKLPVESGEGMRKTA